MAGKSSDIVYIIIRDILSFYNELVLFHFPERSSTVDVRFFDPMARSNV
jgi:hypothetical protein